MPGRRRGPRPLTPPPMTHRPPSRPLTAKAATSDRSIPTQIPTPTVRRREPAEIPPASTPDGDIADSPRPFLSSGHRARPQTQPQADIKPTSDPETQSPSTSSTKKAYIEQTPVDISTTHSQSGPINPTGHVAGSGHCGRQSTGDRRERPGGTRIVDGWAAGRHHPAGRRRPQPAGDRQPASPGHAPADAVWCAGVGTPRDSEYLLQSVPHDRLQPEGKQSGRRQHCRHARRQRSRRHRLHLDRHQACRRRGGGKSRRHVRLHPGSRLRRWRHVLSHRD